MRTSIAKPIGMLLPSEATRPPLGNLVVQQRGDHWLRLMASSVEQTDLVQLLSDIQNSTSGAISLTSTIRLMFAHGTETADLQTDTGFTAEGPKGAFWIETATLSSPLVALGAVGERLEPIAIGDRNGWIISQRTEQGISPYALAWSATPRRIIAVSTNSDRHVATTDLLDIAEQLHIVDEPTWRTALPNAATDMVRQPKPCGLLQLAPPGDHPTRQRRPETEPRANADHTALVVQHAAQPRAGWDSANSSCAVTARPTAATSRSNPQFASALIIQHARPIAIRTSRPTCSPRYPAHTRPVRSPAHEPDPHRTRAR